MNIALNIECPDVSCIRCGNGSALLPLVLRPETCRLAVLVAGSVGRPLTAFEGVSANGTKWQVLAFESPEGWEETPKGWICPRCTAARNELDTAFMEGSLPPSILLPLNARLPAPPPSEEEAIVSGPPRTIYPEQKTMVGRQMLPESSQPRQVVSNAHHQGAPQNTRVTSLQQPPQRFQPAVSAMPTVVRPSTVSPAPIRAHHESVAPPVVTAMQPTVSPIPSTAGAGPSPAGHIPAMAPKSTIAPIPMRGEPILNTVQPNTKDGPDHSEPSPILDVDQQSSQHETDAEDLILPAS